MKTPSFWQSRGLISTLLLPAAAVFSALTALRQSITRPTKLSAPVICIGNAVAGGAGKTPSVLALAKILQAEGKQVFALSRGYGGSLRGPLRVQPAQHDATQIGDEALLLSAHLPTIISQDRPAGARLAISEGAQIILMDDGFQNPSLYKGKQLLVIDGAQGFGNGRVIPAGCLREPAARALARADALLIIGEATAPGLAGYLSPFTNPVFHTRLRCCNGEEFRRQRCLAFAGIARPEKFFRSLAECGATLVKTVAFADHHVFYSREITALLKEAVALNAIPVTTRKDFVRLSPAQQAYIKVLDVALEFEPEEKARLQGWLKEAAHV